MWLKIILIFIFLIFSKNFLSANEKNYYLTLKYSKVNVRIGPSKDYPIKYIYKKKFYPIKVIDSSYNYRKVIDINNNSGWIHSSQLIKKKGVINIKNYSILFSKPSIYSKPIANIEIGKLLLIKKCKDMWCKVSSNNYSGWIKKNHLWGRF